MGPSCAKKETLVEMIDLGMDIARFDLSLKSVAEQTEYLRILREAMSARPKKSIALMVDTVGPEVRLTKLKDNKPIELKEGQEIDIVPDPDGECDETKLCFNYPDLCRDMSLGQKIIIGNGRLVCKVIRLEENKITVKCKNDFTALERFFKVNLPAMHIDLPTLTDQDKDDIDNFVLNQGFDFIGLSFTRSIEEIQELRNYMGPRGAGIRIIAKIEDCEGFDNIDEIIQCADGVMVARRDLGQEFDPEKVFQVQKYIINRSNLMAKPVITASQMLRSMYKANRPTRAEASDVANAVLDGSDAVQLGHETSMGDYPLECVSVMARICAEADIMKNPQAKFDDMDALTPPPLSTAESVARSAARTGLASEHTKAVIVLTENGKIARILSKYDPGVPIIACSTNKQVVKQLSICRGVEGFVVGSFDGSVKLIQRIMHEMVVRNIAVKGDHIICIHGTSEDTTDESNVMELLTIQ